MWFLRILALNRPLVVAAFLPNTGAAARTSKGLPRSLSSFSYHQPTKTIYRPSNIGLHNPPSSWRLYSSTRHDNIDNEEYGDNTHTPSESDFLQFTPGEKVLVEVVNFGPLGASVHVVAAGSHSPQDLPPDDVEWPVLGMGLISQQEVSYFRQSRNNLDVVLGEILPAYIERVRDTDGKLSIGLRAFGGRAKAQDVGQQIMDVLESTPDGIFDLGDKSRPSDIAAVFPGVSKSTFKKALSKLYKDGKIDKPQANEIRLLPSTEEL